MTHSLVSAVVCLLLVSDDAVARGEFSQSDRMSQVDASGSPGRTADRESSWEGWLNHGARDVVSEPLVPLRNSALVGPTAPPSSSAGSALSGPEAGRRPSQRRSNTERNQRGAEIDEQRR